MTDAGSARERVWVEVALESSVPLLVSLALLLIVGPGIAFENDVPALSDLPGHLLPPTVMGRDFLPRGRVQGWSFDWFAGFPAYRYYFPLPGASIALLGDLVGEVRALRVVALLPLLLLPWSLWAFGRLLELGALQVVGLVVVGSTSALTVTHAALGGNLLSMLVGEFSYGWGLLFLVLYAGLLGRTSRTLHHDVLAGLVLAALTLSHVIPLAVAGLGSAAFLFSSTHRRRVLVSWVVAGIVTAFWLLPMVFRIDHLASLGWMVTPALRDVLPLEIALLLPATIPGVLLLQKRSGLAVLAAFGFTAVLLTAIPQGLVGRLRPLPVWYLVVHALAGVGLGTLAAGVRGNRPLLSLVGCSAGVGLFLLVVLGRGLEAYDVPPWNGVLRGVSDLPGAEELQGLLTDLSALPAGRLHWEPGIELTRWGGPHVFGLIPYWTDHSTLSGLLKESSPTWEFTRFLDVQLAGGEIVLPYERTLPDVAWDPEEAVARLRFMGVRYLITHTDETGAVVTRTAGDPVASRGRLHLFDLGPVGLVSPIRCWTAAPADSAFRPAAHRWFETWRPDRPILVQTHLDGAPGRADDDCEGRPSLMEGGVSEVQLGHERIRFRTTEVGVPHLVRVSHFPLWRARGARGPHLAAPWFMVVVPEEPTVTLEYVPGAPERLGRALSLFGVVFLAGLPLWSRLRRRRDTEPGGRRAPTPGP